MGLLTDEDGFFPIWKSLLDAMTLLLDRRPSLASEPQNNSMDRLLFTTQELASEHLRNAIMILGAYGILGDRRPQNENEENRFASLTWTAIGGMTFCAKYLEEWKMSASSGTKSPSADDLAIFDSTPKKSNESPRTS